MFLLSQPNDEKIRRFLEAQKDARFSYAEVGASRRGETVPDGYTIDHNRVELGRGRVVFDRAVRAVRRWKMFDFAWLRLCPDDAPIEVGSTVAILVRHFGFRSLNAARIVYVLDETSEAIEKRGFAYGTLAEHAERGEERFSVEYRKDDDSVWYDLYAFSRPNDVFARLGYPLARMLQKRFAADSLAAMRRAVVDE